MHKLLLVLLLAGFGAGNVQLLDIKSSAPATELVQVEGWVKKCEVEVKESKPPQFDLKLTVPMPTPGWKFEVDDASKAAKDKRIVVMLTATPPEGVVAQVVTDTEVRVQLGEVEQDRWAIEIWYRKEGADIYQFRDVLLFDAN